jgi:hypothetical protein
MPNGQLEQNALKFLCYPNPATTEITVVLPTQSMFNREINLYSIEGKLVQQVVTNKPEIQMDLRALNKGIYFIEIEGTIKRIILN